MTSHRVSERHDLRLRVSERRAVKRERSRRNFAGSEFVTTAVQGLRKSWWVTTILLLVVGAIAQFDLITREDLGPLAPNSGLSADGQMDLAKLTADFETYPGIHYAGIDLALIDSRAIPVNNSGRPIIVADLAVRNTSAVQIRVPLSLMSLVAPDGETTNPDRLEYAEHALRLVVDPGETEQVLAVFKLDSALTADLEDYALQVGETGRWPEQLPFNGEVVETAYPKPLQPVGSGRIADGAIDPIRFGELDVEITDAITSLQFGAYRAPIGQHLAVVTVSITGEPTDVQRAILDQGLWTMFDEDGTRRPIRVNTVDQSPTGDELSQQLVFYYDVEAEDLSLQIGSRVDKQIVAEFIAKPAE